MEIKRALILINDYFLTIGKNIFIDIFLPLIFVLVSFLLLSNSLLDYNKEIIGDILTVLGIISGFGISSVTLLLSSNSNSVNEYKSKKTQYIVDGVEISYFRRLYVLVSYSTITSFIGILVFFIGNLFLWNRVFVENFVFLIKSISIGYITHILIVNIRCIVSIYLMYIRETNN